MNELSVVLKLKSGAESFLGPVKQIIHSFNTSKFRGKGILNLNLKSDQLTGDMLIQECPAGRFFSPRFSFLIQLIYATRF